MEKHIISFGNKKVEFDLFYKERKNLRISVRPDSSVMVIAPNERTIEEIYQKVQKRSTWIVRQQEYFEQFKPEIPPRQYISGETHSYLGRQYRLKIIQSDMKTVKLKGKYFEVKVPDRKDTTMAKDLMLQWYRNHATKKYIQILEKAIRKLGKYGIEQPDVIVRKMNSRWGTCQSDKNRISLNIELIKAPVHCIEYVIVHELVHLKHPYHDKKFYYFLGLIMPDWRERKKRLEIAGIF